MEQCPYAGGTAVYRARSLISLMNDSVDYDDSYVCAQAGYFRKKQETKSILPAMKKIAIVPNPANTEAEVFFINDDNGMCNLRITNVFGEALLQFHFNCNEKKQKIALHTLTPGIYLVKAEFENAKPEVCKLVIVR
jgi:hypothetical protein